MELQEIRDSINKLGTDMSGLYAKAREEKRELKAEEKDTFDKMDADREDLLKTEKRLLRLAELDGTQQRRVEPQQIAKRQADQPERQATSMSKLEGLRSWLLAGSDQKLTAEQRERATKAGIDLGAKNLQFDLAHVALQSLRRQDVKDWQERALSTLNTGSPVDGYYTIADEMMRPLEEALLAFGGMRNRSTIIRTDTGAALPIPTVNDTGNKGEILAENTIVNQKDVTFNQLVLDSYKYSSKMILVSVELLQDNAINLAAFLGRALGERIGRITNEHFTKGDGSGKPNGLMNATTASGTQFAAITPTYAELVAIQHSVDPAYRQNGAWMFSDSMLAEIKKAVDASTGRPLWAPNFVAGEPDTILGDPYVINQDVVAAAGSGAGKSLAYGDLSKYLIRDVRGISLLRLDERFADYHQVAFLAFSRHDGDLLDAGSRPVKHALNKS